jgi:gliding motility-associated lipoprotein GldH
MLSCTDDAVFKDYKNMYNEEWCINDTAKFNAVIDTNNIYNVNIAIRHTTDYEMANMWCFFTMSDSTSVIRKDTVNIPIAEPDGRWLGKGYSLKTVVHSLYPNGLNIEKGSYIFTIEQGMRTRCLKGVKDVGIVVETLNSGSSGKK